MKKIIKYSIYFIALSFLTISCGGDGDDQDINVVQDSVGEDVGEDNGGNDGDTNRLMISIADAQNCESTHPLVGESRELRVSPIYGISGTVTIVSDCEIEFSNFSYNGAGPGVSIYGGTDGDFDAGTGLSIPIEGRTFDRDTFSIFLPEGTTLNDFNSFSVWCFMFNIDFSSVNFGE